MSCLGGSSNVWFMSRVNVRWDAAVPSPMTLTRVSDEPGDIFTVCVYCPPHRNSNRAHVIYALLSRCK